MTINSFTRPPRAVDNRSKRVGEDEDDRNAGRLAHFSPGQVQTEMHAVGARGCHSGSDSLMLFLISFPLSYDRAPSACYSYRYDHHTRLLPYVLNAISDEAKVSGVIHIHHVML